MIPLPDLLFPEVTAPVDARLLEELLEVSFLGAERGERIERALAEVALPTANWAGSGFSEGLFLTAAIESSFALTVGGSRYPLHTAFIQRVLAQPPTEPAVITYRQAILAELASSPEVAARAERLLGELRDLLALFKAPAPSLGLDPASFRLETLRQVAVVVARMDADFAGCSSGLRRLHTAAQAIRGSAEHRLLTALLDHESHLGEIEVRLRMDADGRVRDLTLLGVRENTTNRFYRPPLARWRDRLRLFWSGFEWGRRELTERLIGAVYSEIAPALRTLLQLIGPLEIYLGSLAFAATARRAGLEVCLAEVAPQRPLCLEGLFNPLLLAAEAPPVTCSLTTERADPIVLVTGPNSGGKTRLLQAVGLAQLFGQSGFFVAARRAELPLVSGLFVSLIEPATAAAREGRFGAELLRIRALFEALRPRAMVLIDELCSGTNPSEAVEVVTLVLDLLARAEPCALVTTHFLDFAQQLAASPSGERLDFRQVTVGADRRPTYQLAPGVATTSLASDAARRLGVTFESLGVELDRRLTAFGSEAGSRAQGLR